MQKDPHYEIPSIKRRWRRINRIRWRVIRRIQQRKYAALTNKERQVQAAWVLSTPEYRIRDHPEQALLYKAIDKDVRALTLIIHKCSGNAELRCKVHGNYRAKQCIADVNKQGDLILGKMRRLNSGYKAPR
jgi:hypothetical protein